MTYDAIVAKYGFPGPSMHRYTYIYLKWKRSAHRRTLARSASESSNVFACATKIASALMSIPAARRPSASASTAVVAPPRKGSKTKSPGSVNASMAARTNSGEKRAG